MTNHQKRLAAPESWPVERKTETFTVKAGAGPHGEAGVPLLILLRDVLGYVDSRKEARYALNQDNVVINGTRVSDEERPVGMFDIVAFTEREEYYRVFPDEGGRLSLTPIDEESAGSKLGKVVGKQHVPGGDVQLTLHDGQTLLVDDPSTYGVGDSVVVTNGDSEASDDGDEPRAGEIVAHFEYEEGALATAVAGRHAGRIGTIDEIQVTASSAPNNVLLSAYGDGEPFETLAEYIVIIDENFVDDDSAVDAEPAVGETESDADEAETESDADEAETESEAPESEQTAEGDTETADSETATGDSETADSESGNQEEET